LELEGFVVCADECHMICLDWKGRLKRCKDEIKDFCHTVQTALIIKPNVRLQLEIAQIVGIDFRINLTD